MKGHFKLTQQNEKNVAITYLCGVPDEDICKTFAVSLSTIADSVVRNRAPYWNDPLVDFYLEHGRREKDHNATHFFLSAEGDTPKPFCAVNSPQLEPSIKLIRNGVFTPHIQDILQYTGLEGFIEHSEPYDVLIQKLWGEPSPNGVVETEFRKHLKHSYDNKGRVIIKSVAQRTKNSIIEKIKEGGLSWTPYKKSVVHNALKNLGDDELFVISNRVGLRGYDGSKTLVEVGVLMNRTRETIRGIETRALRTLRQDNNSLYDLQGLVTDVDVQYKAQERERKKREEDARIKREGEAREQLFRESPLAYARATHIKDINLSARAKGGLEREGIDTLATLTTYSGKRLQKIYGFGKNSLEEVENFLAKHKLQLSEN